MISDREPLRGGLQVTASKSQGPVGGVSSVTEVMMKMLHYSNGNFLKPAVQERIQEAGRAGITARVIYLTGLPPKCFHSEPLLT